MVHALSEARRVLRPGGRLIDLRPEAAHRRIGIGEGRRWKRVGALGEGFGEDYAADRAVKRALRDRWFRSGRRQRFMIDRVMDGPADLRQWISEIDQRRGIRSYAGLLAKVDRALARTPGKIVGRGPVALVPLIRLD